MPFLGQDWRSPGQSWVKTEEGWKKTTTDDKNNNVSVQRLVINRELRNGAVSEELWKLKCAITFVWLERDGGRRDFLQKSKQQYEQKQADTHTKTKTTLGLHLGVVSFSLTSVSLCVSGCYVTFLG